MMTVVADSRFYESNANLAGAILYSDHQQLGAGPSGPISRAILGCGPHCACMID
jgi:hypothetical protein